LDRGDLDPYLVTELIRRRTLAAASLSGPPTTSAPPSAGPGSPSAPPRWLDECRRATLQTYRSAAARAGTPDSQLDRARALLDLLRAAVSRAPGGAGRSRADPWQAGGEAVRAGRQPVLAALGHAFADALRSPCRAAFLEELPFRQLLADLARPGAA